MASVSSLDQDMRKLRMDRYTPQAANEVKTWIEGILHEPLPSSDLIEGLKDGVALCKLANLALPSPGVRYKQSAMPFTQRENISQFLTICENPPFNMPSHDRFLTVDLYDGKDPAQVLQCLGAFSRAANSINPSNFPNAIGPKRSASPTKQMFGSSTPKSSPAPPPKPVPGLKPASSDSGYISSAMRASTPKTQTSTTAPYTPSTASPNDASKVSGWTKKADESNTAPAWNVNLYGYMGGASQGNQGISFGSRRQITSQPVGVPNYEEKMRRRREQEAEDKARQEREEAEERQRLAEQEAEEARQARERELEARRQAEQREAEEERAKIEEQKRWLEETRKAQEKERRELEAQKAKYEQEERRRKEEEEEQKRIEEERRQRLEDEENERVRAAEQEKIARLEAEKRRVDEENERLRLEEEQRRAEELKKAQEAKRAEVEAQKRRWEEEELRWKQEAERRKTDELRVEQEKQEREKREQTMKRKPSTANGRDSLLRGQSLSQYQAEQRKGSFQSQTSNESARVRELERQLEEAKERERQYHREREERERLAKNDEFAKPQIPPARQASLHKAPDNTSERDYLRNEWMSNQEQGISPVHSGGPRPPPSPSRGPSSIASSSRSARPSEASYSAAQPPQGPSSEYSTSRYSEPTAPSSNRTDRFLASNPAPVQSQPRIHYPAEMGMTSESERAAEDARRAASQTKTKEGGWGSKSLLQQEMERERERQREWEEQQMQKAKAQGLPVSPKPASVSKRGLIGPRSMAK